MLPFNFITVTYKNLN